MLKDDSCMIIAAKDNEFNLQQPQEILKFLNKYTKKLEKILIIKKLGEGGENLVFYIEPYIPIEVVARLTIQPEGSKGLLLETQMMKTLKNKDFVCQNIEELAVWDEESRQFSTVISVVERASMDLLGFAKMWIDPLKSQKHQDFYS